MVPASVVSFVGNVVREIVNPILGVLFTLALFYFLWGLMVFIFHAGDSAKLADGRRHMVYGVIGMVVMVSAFGLLALLLTTFGIGGSDIPNVPLTL